MKAGDFKIEIVKISKVKPHPNNPRVIRDEQFKKLVQSIKDFPQMLHIRPIVVNDNMEALGGNQRLKAAGEAGLKEIPVIHASTLTPEQQKQFMIKDNSKSGEWDWDQLMKEWDADSLNDWGVTLPNWSPDINSMSDEEVDLTEKFDPVGISAGHQRVVFIFNNKEEAETFLNSYNIKYEKRNMAWQVNLVSPST